MPFTLSHAVLAPPLSKLSKGHLPIAALAIGCMTPDLYRLFTQANIALTHQWSGLLFPNLPIGLFFCLLWYFIYRPVSYRFLGLKDPLQINSFDDVVAFSLMNCFAILATSAGMVAENNNVCLLLGVNFTIFFTSLTKPISNI